VRAEQFELIDQHGRVRARLEVEDDGATPGFVLCDEEGRKRAMFGLAAKEGPFLTFFDADSRPRLSLGLDGDEGPTIQLLDKQGNLRAQLHLSPDKPSLLFLHEGEKPRINLFVMADGQPHLVLTDKEGKQCRGITPSRDILGTINIDAALHRNGR
jgi:hypothetical protein